LSSDDQTQAVSRNYIPHIDGLRTLAVLSVFLYHLDVSTVGGGFVGVDVFFVISGYLITRIIKNSSEKGGFSFSGFYARRVRRLFPALLVVVVLSTLWGGISLSPARLLELAQSGTAAILSVSNFYFYFNSDYFDAASNTQIFLHTWSLSVEEQFYLLWPLLILLVVGNLSKNKQIILMVGLVVLGAGLSFVVTNSDPTLAFYMAPFRLAEFSLGAILCWLTNVRPPRMLAEAISICAIGMLVWSFCAISDQSLFPGLIFLVPCVATSAIIWFGAHSSVTSVLLGNAVITYVGRLSYSLYLYHWVVILFYRYEVSRSLDLVDQSTIFVAAMLLSIVSYHFVEKPFRAPSRFWRTNTHVSAIFFLIIFMLVSVFSWIVRESGFPERVPEEIRSVVAQVEQEKTRRFDLYQKHCRQRSWDLCKEKSMSVPNVIILGDSHGIDGLNVLGPLHPELHFVMAALAGCPPMTPPDFKILFKKLHPNYKECEASTQALSEPSYYQDIDYLVFSQSYSWYQPVHLARYLASLPAEFDGKILIFGNAPSFEEELPELVIEHGHPSRLEAYASDFLLDDTWLYEKELQQLAHDYGGMFVSKTGYYCDREVRSCNLFYGQDKRLLTYDKNHLSVDAAHALSAWFKSEHPHFFDAGNAPSSR
jgi:peptidoglycan/LPS O-acetylase OafA/YrhL